jgi:RNA polymerase sigma factor (sigma-70 family)
VWRCDCPPDDCAGRVRGYLDGDRAAGERIALKFEPLVLAIARRVLGPDGREDLDDARQAIFLRVFANLEKWDRLCPFCKWLAVVAARRAIDFSRGVEVHSPLPSDVPDTRPGPASQLVGECIEQTLARFPPNWRRAFEMAAEGTPRHDIAQAVHKSVRTVQYWLAEIREELQQCLDR